MRTEDLTLTNAADSAYLGMVHDAFYDVAPSNLEAALAYATDSGVATLIAKLEPLDGWRKVRKRWLIGIDYCRSDPTAIGYLKDLPKSEVRIHDGKFVVARNGCVPRVSYHPKLYIFRRTGHSAVILGSGNLSYTGLQVGIEAGVSLLDNDEATLRTAKKWFTGHWKKACSWAEIEKPYSRQYLSVKNRRNPMVTEDDHVPEVSTKRGQITPEQLRQLRVCQHLWVEAGNLHKNRGRELPGNQLMLKRNTRVFFGFPARDLPRDSTVGHVEILFDGQSREDCSIRFSNNSMDVLTLPIPDFKGSFKYDQETLCFTRIGVRKFRLEIGTNGDSRKWKRGSRAINGLFEMKGGRKWGIY